MISMLIFGIRNIIFKVTLDWQEAHVEQWYRG